MDYSHIPTIFDAHLHIIDPHFPLQANHGYLPPDFSCADYRRRVGDLPMCGGAVVSGSFQGFDQTYLLAALETLGEGFVGVTQLPASVSEEEIVALDQRGVRAVRFNLKRGGSEDAAHLDTLARKVQATAGWHIELYVDAAQLDSLSNSLCKLPAVSIDHLGLTRAGLPQLLKLVEHGVRVKATGFSRGDLDIGDTVSQIMRINPDALMFGSDLPCTRAPRAWDERDMQHLCDALDDANVARVFADNARHFYRLMPGEQPRNPE
jgi:predicted TIM-barrel fold metal-dependent hydrolase